MIISHFSVCITAQVLKPTDLRPENNQPRKKCPQMAEINKLDLISSNRFVTCHTLRTEVRGKIRPGNFPNWREAKPRQRRYKNPLTTGSVAEVTRASNFPNEITASFRRSRGRGGGVCRSALLMSPVHVDSAKLLSHVLADMSSRARA